MNKPTQRPVSEPLPPELAAIEAVAKQAADRVDLVVRLAKLRPVSNALEIGVWEGSMSREILTRCEGISRYYMLDPWRSLDDWNKPFNVSDQKFDEVFQTAMEATKFAADRRQVLRGTTTERIDDIKDESLDFIYVDGDHTLRGVVVDMMASWAKLSPGGLMVGDDFSPSIWQHAPKYEPTLVFPFACYFAEAVGALMMALPFRQFVISKPAIGVRQFRFVDLTDKYHRMALLPHIEARPTAEEFEASAALRKSRRLTKKSERRKSSGT